jgi:hypothetical protein
MNDSFLFFLYPLNWLIDESEEGIVDPMWLNDSDSLTDSILLDDEDLLSELYFTPDADVTGAKSAETSPLTIIRDPSQSGVATQTRNPSGKPMNNTVANSSLLPESKGLVQPTQPKEPPSASVDNGPSIEAALGLDRISQLARAQTCNLTIDRIEFDDDRFVSAKATYFVEYMFPQPKSNPLATATSVSSYKVHRRVAVFGRRNVFEVKLDAACLRAWWIRDLTFRFSSCTKNQQGSSPIGEGKLPLKSLLLSEQPSSHVVQIFSASKSQPIVGTLHFSMQLVPTKEPASATLKDDAFSHATNGAETQVPHPSKSQSQSLRDPPLLFVSLMIGCTSNILPRFQTQQNTSTTRDPLKAYVRNIFVVGRVPTSSQPFKTRVEWNQLHPLINYQHTFDVSLESNSYDAFEKGYFILEVWDRCALPDGADELLGLVKIASNQLYALCRDPSLVSQSTKTIMPLVLTAAPMAIESPFTGLCSGNIEVAVAVASSVSQLLDLNYVTAVEKKASPSISHGGSTEMKSARKEESSEKQSVCC